MGSDAFGWSFDAEDTLGGRLSLARESRALSVEQLAAATACSPDTLRYWESDRAAPDAERLHLLASILDVTAAWLMTGFGHGPNWDDVIDVPRNPLAASRLPGSARPNAR